MRFGAGSAGASLVASEPFGSDPAGWLEAPEYSMLVVSRTDGGVDVDVRELDL